MKYKLAILGLVFVIVFILLFIFRGTIRRWTAELNAEIQQREGMTLQRKLLRFSPNKTDNAGVEFYADDLRRETLAMLQFFKERKHLVDDAVGGPSAAEKMVAAIPPMKPGVKNPAANFDIKTIEASLPKPTEKMTTMSGKEPMTTDEYGSTVMEEQDSYRTYNSLKTRETELMDELFGEYFVAKNWSKPDSGMAKTMAIKLKYYDIAYSKVKYHVLQTKEEYIFLPRAFAKYFVVLITKYKNSDTKLGQIKQTLYNILRPTFILQQFFAEYSTNSGKYPAKTDALFFINKCMESLNAENNPNMPTSLDAKGKDSVTLKIGPTGSVHTFKDDDSDYTNRDILADGVSVADSVLVASYIYRLAEINAPHFVMTTETFLRNYAVFLEKNRERKYPGAYEFLLKNIDNIKTKTT